MGFAHRVFSVLMSARIDLQSALASSSRNALCAKSDGLWARVYASLSGVGVFFIALVYSE